MASIVYVTDEKSLEKHRLDRVNKINFWRLSAENRFSNFGEGDLLFFLSKNKKGKKDGEKGIVGYGRAVSFESASVKNLWEKYGSANGYDSYEDFHLAIERLNKAAKFPRKISSIYLENIQFCQNPIYLSELNFPVSDKLESFTYLPESITQAILERIQSDPDLWSSDENTSTAIDEELLRLALFRSYDEIEELPIDNKIQKQLLKLADTVRQGRPLLKIRNSYQLYEIRENEISIYFPKNKKVDPRLYIGEAYYYQRYIQKYYPYNSEIHFYLFDEKGLEKINL